MDSFSELLGFISNSNPQVSFCWRKNQAQNRERDKALFIREKYRIYVEFKKKKKKKKKIDLLSIFFLGSKNSDPKRHGLLQVG